MYIEDDRELEDLLARKAAGPVEPPQLERIFPSIADHDTSFELINRYNSANVHHTLGFRAGQWFETTEQVYWYFLECLPPLHMTGGGFVMSECTTGDLYESFVEIDGRYYCAVVAWDGPQSFSALWSALLAEVAV